MEKIDSGKLFKIAERFSIDGRVKNVVCHKVGHINDTYIVKATSGISQHKYIFQKINKKVFPKPVALMDNIRMVTGKIRERVVERGGDSSREVLNLVNCKDGNHFHLDDGGEFWRCYLFIEGITIDFVEANKRGIEVAHGASIAFGRFQEDLKDVNVSEIHATIDDFHNTPVRFEKFLNAVEEDSCKRCESVRGEIDACLKTKGLKSVITDKIDSGEIPIRVTHNDTKINNIIFEEINGASPSALCVIDLDTVMPGSILYDFGDLVRTTTASSPEDERDLSKVSFDLGLFEALVRGYLKNGRELISNEEMQLLSICGRVITFETGLRFLTDYLEGDKYFQIEREDHNLDRARTQFKLVQCMEDLEGEMASIVKKYW
jgi:thiamine kinase-like enzyme